VIVPKTHHDIEPDRLELTGQLLDLLVGQVVLDGKSLELRRLDEAALLRPLDERSNLLGLEQFHQLVLRQAGFSPFGAAGRFSL